MFEIYLLPNGRSPSALRTPIDAELEHTWIDKIRPHNSTLPSAQPQNLIGVNRRSNSGRRSTGLRGQFCMPNDSGPSFAPFVRSLFPIDSSKGPKPRTFPCWSLDILIYARSLGCVARDSGFASPVGRTLTKGLSEEPA
jgi:hypothetical protein